MSRSVDFLWVKRSPDTTAREAAATALFDRESQVDWWRQRLQDQGHKREHIERLIAQYRVAAWPLGSASSAGD